MTSQEAFLKAFYAALWYETGGLFDAQDPQCINGTNRKKCGTSGGVHDKGGNTKYGIAQNAHPELDIDSLTLSQASLVYKTGYWDACKCDALPKRVAAYVFDIACGSGPRRAAKVLQGVLGLKEDGSIGKMTIAAANAADEDNLLELLRIARIGFYQRIVDKDSTQSVFLRGWTNRANGFMHIFSKQVVS
jgi:lysozyme family protein